MAKKKDKFLCGVYEIRNIKTGKRYVGSSLNMRNRLTDHKRMLRKGIHHSIALQRAYDKYGEDQFVFQFLAILEPEDRLPTEQRLLDLEHQGETYNIAKDAVAWMTGLKHTEEWKKAQGDRSRGNKYREGWPSWCKGQTLSEEHKAKLKAAKQNVSEETREKMRQKKLGTISPFRGVRNEFCRRGHAMTGTNVYRGKNNDLYVCNQCARDTQIERRAKTKEEYEALYGPKEKVIHIREGKESTCIQCGNTFLAKSHNHLVCSVECKFEYNQNKGLENECWVWSGITKGNYPRLDLGKNSDGKRATRSARNYSYEKYIGPIPDNLQVTTTCGNTLCTNPNHLQLVKMGGSVPRNLQDSQKEALSIRFRGEGGSNTKLTEGQAKELKYNQDLTAKDAVEKYGVSVSVISHIRTGRTWKHI